MSSYFNMVYVGQVGIVPAVLTIATSDSLATITTAGWIDSKPTVQKLSASNFVLISYNYNPPSAQGTFQWFTVSIAGGVTTLVPYVSPQSVTLPTVAGQLAAFTNTTGTIAGLGAGVFAKTTAVFAGGGTSNAFVATGLTAASIVVATIATQAGTASIVKAVPSTNTLTVTFSADPGAGTTVNYIAFTAAV